MQRIRYLRRRADKEPAELVAAERHRRHMPHDRRWGQWCTVDKLGDGDKADCEPWQASAHAELRDVEAKLCRRRQGSGTTGAERRRKEELRRAK